MSFHRHVRGGGFVGDTSFVDPTAFVDPSAVVGDRCYIGVGVYIAAGDTIGNDVIIGDLVLLGINVSVGDRVTILQNTVVDPGTIIPVGNVVGPTASTQTTWFMDPANVSGTAADTNDGLTAATAIRTGAEWRRRCFGSFFTTAVTVTYLSGSAVASDSNFSGANAGLGTLLNLVGIPTVVAGGTGTVSAVIPVSANLRGTIADTTAGASWTARGLVSTAAVCKMIRNTARTKHAYVVSDQGGGTNIAAVFNPTNANETAGFSSSISNFTVGETYEVCTLTSIVPPVCNGAFAVVPRCLSMTGTFQGYAAGITSVLCAYISCTFSITASLLFSVQSFWGGSNVINCNSQFVGQNIAVGASLIFQGASALWDSTAATNGVALQASRIIMQGANGALGNINVWDLLTPAPVVSTGLGGGVTTVRQIAGLGNTGKLISTLASSVVLLNRLTAVTTDALPYLAGSTASATSPISEVLTGSSIVGTSP